MVLGMKRGSMSDPEIVVAVGIEHHSPALGEAGMKVKKQ